MNWKDLQSEIICQTQLSTLFKQISTSKGLVISELWNITFAINLFHMGAEFLVETNIRNNTHTYVYVCVLVTAKWRIHLNRLFYNLFHWNTYFIFKIRHLTHTFCILHATHIIQRIKNSFRQKSINGIFLTFKLFCVFAL